MKFFFTRMSRATHRSLCVYLVAVVVGTGCRSTCKDIKFNRPTEFRPIGTQIEYTDTCVDQCSAVDTEQAPHTLSKAKLEDFTYREISLEEAVQTALANSTVMRDLGARVLTAPQGAPTVFDPAITQMNPGVGEEAALSDFDAQWATGIIFQSIGTSIQQRYFWWWCCDGGKQHGIVSNGGIERPPLRVQTSPSETRSTTTESTKTFVETLITVFTMFSTKLRFDIHC